MEYHSLYLSLAVGLYPLQNPFFRRTFDTLFIYQICEFIRNSIQVFNHVFLCTIGIQFSPLFYCTSIIIYHYWRVNYRTFENYKGLHRSQRKRQALNFPSLLDSHYKVGWFSSIFELPCDQGRLNMRQYQWNTMTCIFLWLWSSVLYETPSLEGHLTHSLYSRYANCFLILFKL